MEGNRLGIIAVKRGEIRFRPANLERIRRSSSVSIVVVCKNSAFAIFPGSILLARQSTLRKGRPTKVRETMSDVANSPEILAKWIQIFLIIVFHQDTVRHATSISTILITVSINSRICANFSNETKDSEGTLSCFFFFLYIDSNSLK